MERGHQSLSTGPEPVLPMMHNNTKCRPSRLQALLLPYTHLLPAPQRQKRLRRALTGEGNALGKKKKTSNSCFLKINLCDCYLGLRSRIIFRRYLWVGGLPGVCIKSPGFRRTQRGEPDTDALLKQILRQQKKKADIQSHGDCKRDWKGNLFAMETQEKCEVHMEVYRWRNSNLHANISKRALERLCSPKTYSKREYINST